VLRDLGRVSAFQFAYVDPRYGVPKDRRFIYPLRSRHRDVCKPVRRHGERLDEGTDPERRQGHAPAAAHYTRAKQLWPVANKPVLFYGIEALAAAGIRDIGIVVGDTAAEIKHAVVTGRRGCPDHLHRAGRAACLAHAVLISEDFLGQSRS